MAIFGFKSNKCKGSVYTTDEVDSKLNAKSNSTHIHDDRYYTETEIDSKLGAKSDTSHTHDDRYYTETESDTMYKKRGDFAVIRRYCTFAEGKCNEEINYPYGFNQENCVVVGFMANNYSADDSGFCYGFYPTATGYVTGAIGASIKLGSAKIQLKLCNPTEGSHNEGTNGYEIKIILMKTEILNSEYTLGDVNRDGKITAEDSQIILDYSTGQVALTEQQFKAGDVDKDGKVLASDATRIGEYLAGELDSLE